MQSSVSNNQTTSTFEKLLPQLPNPLSKPSFSPFLANSLLVKSGYGFRHGCACYNEKHNFIIACPSDSPFQLYDATTLSPLERRKPFQMDRPIIAMSYDQETDTYLL